MGGEIMNRSQIKVLTDRAGGLACGACPARFQASHCTFLAKNGACDGTAARKAVARKIRRGEVTA